MFTYPIVYFPMTPGSEDEPYVLPAATADTLGGVKVTDVYPSQDGIGVYLNGNNRLFVRNNDVQGDWNESNELSPKFVANKPEPYVVPADVTDAYDSDFSEGFLNTLKVAAGVKITAGCLVCVKGNGYAVPASDTSGLKMAGVAVETVDNTNGSDGDKSVRVYRRGLFTFDDSGAVQADIGKVFYIVDEHTITNASTTAGIAGGVCVEHISETKTRIAIDNKAI